MLLKDKDEILETMNEELEGASDSSIKWLADTFNVPFRPLNVKRKAKSAYHRKTVMGKKAAEKKGDSHPKTREKKDRHSGTVVMAKTTKTKNLY